MSELLANAIRRCTRCPLGAQATNHCTWRGTWKRDVRVLFVGEGPGSTEDEVGLPFVGRSGKQLDEWITLAGLGEGDYLIANVVNCFPHTEDRKPRRPSKEEVKACRIWISSIITLTKPRVIVALGATARDALKTMGVTGVIAVPHPASYMYSHRDWTKDVAMMKAAIWNALGERR